MLPGCRRPRGSRPRSSGSTKRRAFRRFPTTTSTEGIRRARVMPVWQVILFANLTLAVGLGLGYAGWGRRAEALERDLDALRVRVQQLERERAACATGARTGEQQWEARGVVRAIYPEGGLLVITHEEIRGLLPARTTSFRAAPSVMGAAIRVGDAIRFSLRGTPEDNAVVAIAQWTG